MDGNQRIERLTEELLEEVRAANPSIADSKLREVFARAKSRITKEPPPQIAFIGEAGVGKSSTLNALFNAGQETGHYRATTRVEAPIEVQISKEQGANGVIIVYDMPGIGESIRTEEQHVETYRRVLEQVDAAVWVLDAGTRAIGSVQVFLSQWMSTMNPHLVNKIVFGVNKVDTVFPGETAWHPLANLPSQAQEQNIEARLEDIRAKIREALPNWKGSVVGYSATRRFGLMPLFIAMVDALPKKRRWALTSREAIADFLELVDGRLLEGLPSPASISSNAESVQASRQPSRREEPRPDEISDEDFQEAVKSKDAMRAVLARLRRPNP